MIRARNPRRDDRTILGLVKRELFVYTVLTRPETRWDPADVRRRLDGDVTFVAAPRRAAKMVGFVSVRSSDRTTMLLDLLAVDPGSQGKGWGTALLEQAERYARDRGYREMKLFVDEANGKARLFYARNGYGEVEYIPSFAFIVMAKRL